MHVKAKTNFWEEPDMLCNHPYIESLTNTPDKCELYLYYKTAFEREKIG
ncbi:MAG: hypothetical protein OEZ13_11865 [Spirochaetia bacterium]|nr:hypothetical protein [Spirochaetia bacterium]